MSPLIFISHAECGDFINSHLSSKVINNVLFSHCIYAILANCIIQRAPLGEETEPLTSWRL